MTGEAFQGLTTGQSVGMERMKFRQQLEVRLKARLDKRLEPGY